MYWIPRHLPQSRGTACVCVRVEGVGMDGQVVEWVFCVCLMTAYVAIDRQTDTTTLKKAIGVCVRARLSGVCVNYLE